MKTKLYHNTNLFALERIFTSGFIGLKNVSLTRSKSYKYAPGAGLDSREVRLVFDRDKLNQRYKLFPHADAAVKSSKDKTKLLTGNEARWESEERTNRPITLKDVEEIQLDPKTKVKIDNKIKHFKHEIAFAKKRLEQLTKGYFWHQTKNEWAKIENERQEKVHHGSRIGIENIIKTYEENIILLQKILSASVVTELK